MGEFMKLDLFILGCVSEKPVKVKSLLEIADYIRLSKWLSYTTEKLIERLDILNELGYIRTYENKNEAIEKCYFSSTDLGMEYLHNNLKTYIKGNETDMGMIILFLTFSNHLSRLEIIHIIEKKVEVLKHKLEKTIEMEKITESDSDNKIRDLSLKTLINFRKSEISIYEELLHYAKGHDAWNDFLVLKDKWEYSL